MLIQLRLLGLYGLSLFLISIGLSTAFSFVCSGIARAAAGVVEDCAQKAPPEPPLVGGLAHFGAMERSKPV